MKISEVKDENIIEYCGMTQDIGNLNLYKESAVAFIMGYTGLTKDEINEHEDLTLAYLVLINDMSFNRDYTVSRDTLNPSVQTILSMYSKNNIG